MHMYNLPAPLTPVLSFRFSVQTLMAMVGLFWILLFFGTLQSHAENPPPNVLFIMVDDLRDWNEMSVQFPQVKTPNLKRLAEMGVVFSNAHCAAPVCAPSRTALLSGRSPAETGVYTNGQDWVEPIRESPTLTSHFMDGGYHVAGFGKIYHGQGTVKNWHEYVYGDYSPAPENPEYPEAFGNRLYVPDDATGDGMRVNHAIAVLQRRIDRPLFLACGLVRPHTPWDVPSKYFDLYPLDSIELPEVLEQDLEDIPRIGQHIARRPHINRYHGRSDTWSFEQIRANGMWKVNLQAYLASITYADAQIGRLLDAWLASPYAENGIIVLMGDHGWHHGEKLHWSKRTLWDVGTRTPLILSTPERRHRPATCTTAVDLLDVYPTLIELCGLPPRSDLDGISLRPLLEHPEAKRDRPAITIWGRGNIALRHDQWRYIRYCDGSEELYDHRNDPHEWHNLASDPELQSVKDAFQAYIPDRFAPYAPFRKGENWFEREGLLCD